MAEREADLARVEAQVKSLRQVEAEQQNIIDKLAVARRRGEDTARWQWSRRAARRGSRGKRFLLYGSSEALGE